MARVARVLSVLRDSVYSDAWRKLRLLASLYTFAQRMSSPQRTTYTVASLPLMS